MGKPFNARMPWTYGRKVIDGRQPITINVKREHVEAAVASNGALCVVAQTVKQALGADHVIVFRTKCYVDLGSDRPIERLRPSRELVEKVINPLDEGHPERIVTGRYDLVPVKPSERLGEPQRSRWERRKRQMRGDERPSYHRKARGIRSLGRIRSI
jgi:hypothetical protein